MFNLDDILRQAQGGGAYDALARQFGLSAEQAQAAVEAVTPAFQMGLQRQAQDPQALGQLFQQISSGQYAAAAQNPFGMAPQAGNEVLAQLFGSKDGSRAVAQQAAAFAGVPSSIMKAMLPVIASMLIGGMFKQANGQGMGGMLGQLAGALLGGAGAGGLGSVLGGMFGGGQAAPQPQSGGGLGGGGLGPLGDILGQMMGGGQAPQQTPQGGGLGDILGQVLGGGAAGGQASGGGLGPLGDILGQMMGGGRATTQADDGAGELPQGRAGGVEDEISDMLGGGRSAPQSAQGGSLGDVFGQMFQTGQQASQAQTDAWQDVFAQITGQRRR